MAVFCTDALEVAGTAIAYGMVKRLVNDLNSILRIENTTKTTITTKSLVRST